MHEDARGVLLSFFNRSNSPSRPPPCFHLVPRQAEVVPAQCATPRTELPTDESADEVPRHAAPRATQLTASTARRLRRKRAAERVRMVQSVQLRVPSMEDFRTR